MKQTDGSAFLMSRVGIHQKGIGRQLNQDAAICSGLFVFLLTLRERLSSHEL